MCVCVRVCVCVCVSVCMCVIKSLIIDVFYFLNSIPEKNRFWHVHGYIWRHKPITYNP